jgi:hypothetical protein
MEITREIGLGRKSDSSSDGLNEEGPVESVGKLTDKVYDIVMLKCSRKTYLAANVEKEKNQKVIVIK